MVLNDGFVPIVVCGKSAVRAPTLLHVCCSPCFHYCWWHGASSSVRLALLWNCFSLSWGIRGGYFLSVCCWFISAVTSPTRLYLSYIAPRDEMRDELRAADDAAPDVAPIIARSFALKMNTKYIPAHQLRSNIIDAFPIKAIFIKDTQGMVRLWFGGRYNMFALWRLIVENQIFIWSWS